MKTLFTVTTGDHSYSPATATESIRPMEVGVFVGFDTIPISVGDMLKSEIVFEQYSLQPWYVIEENYRDVVIFLEFL